MANTDTEQVNEQSAKTQELLLVAQQGDFNVQFKLGNAGGVTQDEENAITLSQKVIELQSVNEENQPQSDSIDLKPWLNLLAQEKLRALQEQEKLRSLLEQERKARRDLEDVMGMFAHKFQGPLLNVQYDAEHNNHSKLTLKAVQTMRGLLKVFSAAATDPQVLRQKLQQDMQGDGTLAVLLEKVLLSVIKQVLIIDNTQKIRQHYLRYAKQTGQVPVTMTRRQWIEDYYSLEAQLQAGWEESFLDLLTEPHLDLILAWIEERFFPLEASGFDDETIHFESYGAT